MKLGENSKIAIGCVITAVVMLGFNFVVGTMTAGIDAQAIKQIEEVVHKEMLLPDNRTFGQAIVAIEQRQAVIGTKVDLLVGRAAAIAEDEEGP